MPAATLFHGASIDRLGKFALRFILHGVKYVDFTQGNLPSATISTPASAPFTSSTALSMTASAPAAA
jgi:hypothetical protein